MNAAILQGEWAQRKRKVPFASINNSMACAKSEASIHHLLPLLDNRVTRYQPSPQEQAQRKKEALAERVEKLSRVRILEAIRKKLPDALSRPDLEMVALDYFRRLGHDNHRRLSKLYATLLSFRAKSAKRGISLRCHGALKPWTTRRSQRLP